jgi:hypothetical protein
MTTRKAWFGGMRAALAAFGGLVALGLIAQPADLEVVPETHTVDRLVLPALRFENVSLIEVVKSIRQMGSNENVNIVVAREAEQSMTPSIQLRNVTVEEALRAIGQVSEPPFVVRPGPIITIVPARPTPAPEASKHDGTTVCEVFSLGPYFDRFASVSNSVAPPQEAYENLRSGIQRALDFASVAAMQRGGDSSYKVAGIDYHRETRTLVVVGSRAGVALVGQFINAATGESVPHFAPASGNRTDGFGFFMVSGEVNHPGRFPLPSGRRVDVLEALAVAGDLTAQADKASIQIRDAKGTVRRFTYEAFVTSPTYLESGDTVLVKRSVL